jgi:hypothetical protein
MAVDLRHVAKRLRQEVGWMRKLFYIHLCSSKGALRCLLPFATGVLQADSRQYRNSHEIPLNHCCDSLKAHSCGDATTEADVKGLVDKFELAIEHFLFRADTGCLDALKVDGSGWYTYHSALHQSRVDHLDLFEPYERYLGALQSC